MVKIKSKCWQNVVIPVLSLVLAFLVSNHIGSDLSSLDIFAPSNKKGDFKITDIYNAVEINNYRNRPYSEDVVVVGIDDLDRKQTLDVIHKIAQLQPAAIGLDFAFEDPGELRDSILFAIVGDDRIVSPIRLDTNNMPVLMSFYEMENPDIPMGYVNIMADHPKNVLRTFRPYVIYNGYTIPSLVLELAMRTNPESAQSLLERNREVENINFVRHRIEVIADTLLDRPDVAKRIQGKAVLIGDTAFAPDMRITPIHELMAGVKIHAYALQTVLANTYIEEKSDTYIWTWAVMISIIFLFLLLIAKLFMPESGNFFIRMIQCAILFGIVISGCWLFSEDQVYADLTRVITLAGFSALFFDLLNFLFSIPDNAKRFIHFCRNFPDSMKHILTSIKNKCKS